MPKGRDGLSVEAHAATSSGKVLNLIFQQLFFCDLVN